MGLDADEIRIKMDQILDWNASEKQPDKTLVKSKNIKPEKMDLIVQCLTTARKLYIMNLMYTDKRKNELIKNAEKMMNKAQSKWAVMFWTGVWKQLCIKFNRVN